MKVSQHQSPADAIRQDAFLKVAEFLESHDEEQTTVNALIVKMKEYLTGDIEPYGFTHMKQNIINHFHDNIIVTEINGKANAVTFKHTASSILGEFLQYP